MFSEVICMSVQSKIDGEFSVLVDNISKIALAIERKGVHSSGELANYAAEIDSILVGSTGGNSGEITEEKKKEIILSFVKGLGYSRPEDIVSAYEYISKTLGLVDTVLPSYNSNGFSVDISKSLGSVGFVISPKVDISTITYRYTLEGIDGSSYTSDIIHPEVGVNCVSKTLSAYNDSLLGRDDERTLICFLTDIHSVDNNLKYCSVDVFVNGNKINFSKRNSGENDNKIIVGYNIFGDYTLGGRAKKCFMDYSDSIVGDVLYRKLKYLYSLSEDGTTMTTYMDSSKLYRHGELYTDDFGMVNRINEIPVGVTTIVSGSFVDSNILYNISMDYDYVNAFVSRGYVYKFAPKVNSAIDQGFVGMVGAKEPIGVTLWNGEVVVFPKGTNKYNLNTKTFEPWDGHSYETVDHL